MVLSQRSQVSAFLILGVLLVIIIGFGSWFFMQQRAESVVVVSQSVTGSFPSARVESFLRSCVQQAVDDSVLEVGRSGGFANAFNDGRPHQHHYFVDDGGVSYFIFDGESRVPTVESVRSEVSLAVKNAVETCADWSKIVDVQIVRTGSFVVETSFSAIGTTVRVSSDALFSFGDKEFSVGTIEASSPYRLKLLLEKATTLASSISASSRNSLDISTVCGSLSSSDGLVNVYLAGSSTGKVHLVSIVDSSPLTSGLPPLRLRFGVKGVALFGGCSA